MIQLNTDITITGTGCAKNDSTCFFAKLR